MQNLPKDLLIKLILVIEKTIRLSKKASYQEVYDRQNKIYEESDSMFPKGHWVLVDRCSFPNCPEFQVFCNMKDTKPKLLNSCRWDCKDLYYCDAHDKLHYVKDERHEQDLSVCEKCLPKAIKRGLTLIEKDLTDVDKEKIKKQLAKDAARLIKRQNKIPTYYAMSKQQLIQKLVDIGNETRRKCEKEHQKEVALFEDIMRTIHSLAEQE